MSEVEFVDWEVVYQQAQRAYSRTMKRRGEMTKLLGVLFAESEEAARSLPAPAPAPAGIYDVLGGIGQKLKDAVEIEELDARVFAINMKVQKWYDTHATPSPAIMRMGLPKTNKFRVGRRFTLERVPDHIYQVPGMDAYLATVPGSSGTYVVYVNLDERTLACTCPAYKKGKTAFLFCKHIISVLWHLRDRVLALLGRPNLEATWKRLLEEPDPDVRALNLYYFCKHVVVPMGFRFVKLNVEPEDVEAAGLPEVNF